MKTINIKNLNKICGHTFSMFKQTSVDPRIIMFHYNLMLINQPFYFFLISKIFVSKTQFNH